MLPGFFQVKLDTCDPDEYHHRPPGDAIEGLDDCRAEHKTIVFREDLAENAGAQQNASDNLHHDQRRVVVGSAQPPNQIRGGKNDRHRDQEYFCGAHHFMHGIPGKFGLAGHENTLRCRNLVSTVALRCG